MIFGSVFCLGCLFFFIGYVAGYTKASGDAIKKINALTLEVKNRRTNGAG